RTRISPSSVRWRLHWGHFTVICFPAMATFTSPGTGIGDRPTRDISLASSPSPHEAEDLAAHAALARLAVGHETLAGGQDGYSKATQDSGQSVGLAVDPEPGLGHAAEPGDGPGPLRGVLHRDLQAPPGAAGVVLHGAARDVPLPREDGPQGLLDLGARHPYRLVLCDDGDAAPGVHYRDRIGYGHVSM